MKLARTVCALFLFALVSACGTVSYTPSPDTNKFEPIPEFRSENAIRLYNDQPSRAEVVVYDTPGIDMVGNLHEWTDVAIVIATRELTRRGFTISEDAPRSLGIKVASSETIAGFTTIDTTLEIHTRLDDGKKARHIGLNTAVLATIIRRHIDGALMRGVASMLRDPEIVAYLTAPQ